MKQGCLWLNSKAQAFMPDFLGSILVFTIVISIFMFSWSSVQNNQQKFSLEDDMRQNAYYTTTFLVSTPGYPENWNSSNVEIPGFANSSDNVVSDQKLREFRDLSYDRQKAILGVGNFRLSFHNKTDILYLDSEELDFGKKPVNASTVVPVNRNVIVNKSGTIVDAEMRYVVWR